MVNIYYAIIVVVSLFALIGTVAIAMNQTKLQSASSAKEDFKELMVENRKGSSVPLLIGIYSVFALALVVLITLFAYTF
ncbi:hypothetical protein H0266_15930 [Halobacillus locisalis]|uniref:Uncharacterized protein n=1 Tax=Halobacillus locisalis TaxID=220753 RepID=A0A838CWH3_9BACI|nr:hypothetical protein [Halobacillus locisalis]MBA2176387.1 hypothetical protein [Halobacillus locisalis]